MPFFAGIHPTLYTKLSLILSLYKVSSFVPKVEVKKTENGELSINLLFNTVDYRSDASCYGAPVLTKTKESRKSDSQFVEPESSMKQPSKYSDSDSQYVRPKYKSPSKLKRDKARLLAYRKRWSSRSEFPSKGANSSTSCITNFGLECQYSSTGYTANAADFIPNMINELIYEPTKSVIFMIYMVVGLILLLYDT